MKNGIIVKSNKVVEASYRLTLNEQRLILACVQQIKKGQAVTVADRFVITASDFIELFNVSPKQVYTELQTVAERLYERSVIIYEPDPDDPSIAFTKTRWISSIDYKPKQGQLVLRFAYRMLPYISMLGSHFTRYNMEAIARINSVHGVRFYELFRCWLYGNVSGEKEISLEELKHLLDLDGQYSSIKDFKLRVLDVGIEEVNQHSDMTASYTQRKQGRVVSHFIFEFSFKTPPKPTKTKPKRITKTQIEKAARPGESYEEVKARLEEQLNLAI